MLYDDRKGPGPLCIYHGQCLDGFTAAWVVKKKFPNAELYPGIYNAPPPDVAGRDVIIVDFSYSFDEMTALAEQAKSITVLDHHDGVARALSAFKAPNAMMCFDMERSGARMAWDYFFPNEAVPKFVLYIEDRDLWKFKRASTKQVNAFASSFDYEIKTWDTLVKDCEDIQRLQEIYRQGDAILRKQYRDIRAIINTGVFRTQIGGYIVPMVNMPYSLASEAGMLLSQREAFAATYYDEHDRRKVSLRSTGGINVAKIAEMYGGSGHPSAAGFYAPLNWRGDDRIWLWQAR